MLHRQVLSMAVPVIISLEKEVTAENTSLPSLDAEWE